MSEYQYYEFQAVDRPLSEKEIDEVGQFSTRAEITSRRFTNEYHWGDFRGDPRKLMQRYYDAHLYLANWGTRRLMLKVPLSLLDLEAVREYCSDESVAVETHQESAIVTLESDQEGGWGYEDEGGEGRLDRLIPLREELMAGDLRCLYVAWLAGIDMLDEDEVEPPISPGLGKLSRAQEALADFLMVDDCLLEAAAALSDGAAPSGPSDEELKAWVGKLPAAEKDRLVVEVLSGEGQNMQAIVSLRRQFRTEWKQAQGPTAFDTTDRRTVQQLRDAGQTLREERERKLAEEKAKKKAEEAKKKAAERKKELQLLSARKDEAWAEVESLLKTTQPKNYKTAVQTLRDLQELAQIESSTEEWHRHILQFREQYSRKYSLMNLFDKSSFPRT